MEKKQLILFGEEEFESFPQFASARLAESGVKHSHYYRKIHHDNLNLAVASACSAPYGMPVLHSYNGLIPSYLIPFHEAISARYHCGGVHFYIDDYLFARIWRNPDRYIPLLKRFLCVIGPDFSQYRDMPYAMRMYNCFRNRLLTQYLQERGVRMIPNVTWSLPDSYDYSFSGIPQHSVIAINCTGIVGCDFAKYLWYKGYFEAIERLQPSLIIRYGDKMEDELISISRYYQNERLNMLRNGSKR